MPRQKLMPVDPPAPAIDTERLAEDARALDIVGEMNAEASENALAIAREMGYDGAMTVGGLEDEIRFYQKRTVEACLELGKRLLILKELTPHGEFEKRVELLGIKKRMAQRFMSSVMRFSKAASTTLLKAAGNQSKLLELLVLDDEEIGALAEGGSARGVDLDAVDRMSASELRRALRESQAESESRARNLAERGKENMDLRDKLAKSAQAAQLSPPNPVEIGEALRQEVGLEASAIEARMRGSLESALRDLHGQGQAAGIDHGNVMAGYLCQMEIAIAHLREEFALPDRPSGDPTPEWMGPAGEALLRAHEEKVDEEKANGEHAREAENAPDAPGQ
uniref:DUF3102 domain-containing protein n=1 Tax=Candidatus Kentrum sp. LPFa TaxID=2126335 RepID=A0A450WDG9_9GAMM|nr:MAG: Protein of unknown function (DUF3102) [Candidatus Kentron sp. LPFa]